MAYSSRINKLRDDPNFDLTNSINEDGNTLINHCNYYDISEISYISDDDYNLKILHLNICTLNKNIDKLKLLQLK